MTFIPSDCKLADRRGGTAVQWI